MPIYLKLMELQEYQSTREHIEAITILDLDRYYGAPRPKFILDVEEMERELGEEIREELYCPFSDSDKCESKHWGKCLQGGMGMSPGSPLNSLTAEEILSIPIPRKGQMLETARQKVLAARSYIRNRPPDTRFAIYWD